jgi:hypothetical protein
MSLGNRRACQQGECQPDHQRLAPSVNCLIEHASDGLEKLAGRLAGEREIHYSKSALYQFANAYQADAAVRVPLCVVDAIEELYGCTVVTEAMARRRGGVFVKLPEVDAGDATDVEQDKAAIKEFSEAMSVDRNDPEAVDRETAEAVAALLRISKRAKEQATRNALTSRLRPQAVAR